MSITVMKHTRLISFITASITALVLFFGVGPMHSLFSSWTMHSTQREPTIQCQSICPNVLNEKQKTPQVDEDDADPDPLPFQALPIARYATLLYAVLMSALALQFLQRRPPDLLVRHGLLRI